jgi:catecholate siderophore receptor
MAGTRFHKRRLFSALLLAFAAMPAAQSASEIHGRVLDATHAPVAGARIAAVHAGDSAAASAVSGRGGEFSFDVAPGSYTLVVAMDGFQESRQAVEAGKGSPEVQVVLEIAGAHETITVSEAGGYQTPAVSTATKTLSPLIDLPQSITVVPREQMADQMMMSMADVVRYVSGVTAIQGENNRDQVVIRGNNSSADFFLDGVRDDVQYYRDLYNVERVEALKGPDAMIFGRGGGGGVVNRVTKEAGPAPLAEFTLLGGSFGNKRFTADFDRPLNDRVAFRFNGLYENSGSFRNSVSLKRFGLNPTLAFAVSGQTRITLGYEHFRDDRVADRGVPSYRGRPVDVPIETYFGDPENAHVGARVNLGSAVIEHNAGAWSIRNRTLIGEYDRGYQNFVPGAVSADGTQDSLSAYNNATRRRNLINQTDATRRVSTGRVRHTLLAGVEASRQLTDNFRNTGYFNNTATAVPIPLAEPTVQIPVTFRQSATDANNHLETNVGAVYAQDQVELTRRVQAIAGLRFDHFDLRYHDNRSGMGLRRIDNMASPRAGVVFKLAPAVSLYGSYSVSHLPSAGDQFSSLTTITAQVKPEQFTNYEGGVKWDATRNLSLTAAVYRLDRTNTRATDPNDPTRIVQTGSQRTNGVEMGGNGNLTRWWRIAWGYAYQDAFILSATTAAAAGAQVAQAPHHTFSFWNHCQVRPKLALGLGIVRRADMFAAVDNSVVLPAYTRADAAVYYTLTEKTRLQANVENLLDRKYSINADNNNNISPGSPRAVRVGVIARF